MAITMRVSLPGYNALTETDVDKYALYADSDNILIKEKARGSVTVAAASSQNIAHGLSYIPMVLVFCEAGEGEVGTAGRWVQVSGSDSQSIVGIEVTTTNLIITNDAATHSKNFKYYIFYDQQV